MAREIIPKWTNASAANTMEYENALEAQMMEGHGAEARSASRTKRA